MTETDKSQSELSGEAGAEGEKIVFVPVAGALIDRMEKIAWEQDLSLDEVATACCRYGVHRYTRALCLEEND